MKDDLIYRRVAIEAIEDTDWYHINRCGELVQGANSEEDTPLFKADDIYRVLDSVPSAPPEITLEHAIDYLHSIGWLQEHDRILTESAQQEIIRCGDCKYFDDRPGWQSCQAFGKWFGETEMYGNDFCSKAERRADD